jgi:hypothetical protein
MDRPNGKEHQQARKRILEGTKPFLSPSAWRWNWDGNWDGCGIRHAGVDLHSPRSVETHTRPIRGSVLFFGLIPLAEHSQARELRRVCCR